MSECRDGPLTSISMNVHEHSEELVIAPFRDRDRHEFERLNRSWLEGHGILEAADLPYLLDPRGTILDAGGQVYCARRDDRVLGVCGIVPKSDDAFELVKLAVDPSARGVGLGRRLTETAIEFAREHGARTVRLSTNHQLVAAIRLYERLGFRAVPPPPVRDYATADVYMELRL